MAWMPGASRVQTYRGNRHKRPISKIVLHTTEGSSWPGYGGGGYAPHFTIRPGAATKANIRQHIDTAQSSKALVNRRGGVETNNAGVIQIEFIGSCDRAYARRHGLFFTENADDQDLAGLAKVLAWIHEEHGVPLTIDGNLSWPTTNAAYRTAPQRLSYAAWNRYRGVLGHTHVPENDHWDPGNFPVSRLLVLARRVLNAGNIPGGGTSAPRPVRDPARPWRTSPRVAAMTRAEVREIQQTLLDLGHDLGRWGADGSYGDATGTAVKQLQTHLNITSDGIYGPGTEKALMATLDEISKDLATIKRTLEPGVSGKRTDGELVAALRGFRNDIPGMVLDEPIKLAGAYKGTTSSARTKLAWLDHERERQTTAVLKAVTEAGKAQGLDDGQVQAIVDAVAAVSAEDVAERLDVTVREG